METEDLHCSAIDLNRSFNKQRLMFILYECYDITENVKYVVIIMNFTFWNMSVTLITLRCIFVESFHTFTVVS